MAYQLLRVVIFGKTYPELSVKHTETVCTGALRVDTGAPVRLYPVPLRYLDDGAAYSLYDEIAVPVAKSTSDPRPESFKVDARRIQFVSHMDTAYNWEERRVLVFRDTSWHFPHMEALKQDNLKSERSLGMVQPGRIEEVELAPKSDADRAAYQRKSADVRALKEADLFDPTYKELEYLPYHIRLHWRCREGCGSCLKRPHAMKVLDWGLLELARRMGWEKAVQKLEEISNVQKYDFRLFLGNFRLHIREFGIIGLWYPRIPEQPSFF
jgi:hypothetical protein